MLLDFLLTLCISLSSRLRAFRSLEHYIAVAAENLHLSTSFLTLKLVLKASVS